MSPRVPDPAQVEAEIEKLFVATGLPYGGVFEPLAILKALDVEIVVGEYDVAHGFYLRKPWPTVGVSARVLERLDIYRQVLMRAIACYIADRLHLITHDALVDIGMPDDDPAICRLISRIEAALTIPGPELSRLLASGEYGNFEIANIFRTTLEIATGRLIDLLVTPEPGIDLDAIRQALKRSRTRLELFGSPDIDRYVEIDPMIINEPLFDVVRDQMIALLTSAARPANEGSGATVDILLKRLDSPGAQEIFSRMPLTDFRNIRDSLAALPGGYGILALARLFLKLGHPRVAVENLKGVDWETLALKAESLALRARIARALKGGENGHRASEQLNRAALAADPACVEARLGLANDLVELGRPVETLRVLTELQGKPYDAIARYYFQGKAYSRLRDYERAEHAFLLLASRRGHAFEKRALSRLAKLYADQGKVKLAIKAWEDLLSLRPYDMKAVRLYIDYLISVRRTPEAIVHLTRISRCAPLQPFCALVLADVYERSGDIQVAESFREESRLLTGFWARQHVYTSLGE